VRAVTPRRRLPPQSGWEWRFLWSFRDVADWETRGLVDGGAVTGEDGRDELVRLCGEHVGLIVFFMGLLVVISECSPL
jgi:hypothetical protein